MKLLRRSSLDAAVAAWLQAESESPRFGHHVRLGDHERRPIDRPDLTDPAENALRRRLLAYRDDILTTIPADTAWWEADLDVADLGRLLAINYPAWEIYSGGTGKLIGVAAAIRDGLRVRAADPTVQDGLRAIRENVRRIYRVVAKGRSVGTLVLLGRAAEGPFTAIEGNKRAAALCWCHCLDGVPCPGVAALVGTTPAPCPWLSPHAAS